jgi:hypothetical protein
MSNADAGSRNRWRAPLAGWGVLGALVVLALVAVGVLRVAPSVRCWYVGVSCSQRSFQPCAPASELQPSGWTGPSTSSERPRSSKVEERGLPMAHLPFHARGRSDYRS